MPMRLITTLVFFFTAAVLAGCAAPGQLLQHRQIIARQTAEIDSLRTTQRHLRAEVVALRDSLQFIDDIDSGQYYRDRRTLEDRINKLEYQTAIAREGGLTVATLLVDDLFEPASATLTPGGQALLADVVATLQKAHPDRPVRVEGHSDSVPVGPSLKERYPSNWELSAARAAAVVRYLVDIHEMAPARLEVAAFSASRPAASNDSAEGRRRNRRIRIAVVPE